jgi:2',3'-cyclic-nucleotide 2'-phosphodiesterase (5'-nucleotidase family)
MKKLFIYLGLSSAIYSFNACSSHYELTNVSKTRIVVDSRYDQQPSAKAIAFLTPYKHEVDSVMGPIVGTSAQDMAADRPESDLSNLLSDILMWASKDYNEKPDFSIYNMGGIRSALSKGPITYGDVLAIAPFENKICFLTLSGEKLLELFRQIAIRGGEGVCHGTELVISQNGELLSARLHGKEIDPKGEYRVATIDYLVQGNDGLNALSFGTKIVSPQADSNNTRFIIMKYLKELTNQGKAASAKVEGRIVVK